MVIAADFDYARPATLEEAVTSLGEHGPGASLLAGGTDIVPWMCDDAVAPQLVVDLKTIPGLDEISRRNGNLHLGALVTLSDLLASGMTLGNALNSLARRRTGKSGDTIVAGLRDNIVQSGLPWNICAFQVHGQWIFADESIHLRLNGMAPPDYVGW